MHQKMSNLLSYRCNVSKKTNKPLRSSAFWWSSQRKTWSWCSRKSRWVYTDTYRSYDALNVSEFHHERINHSEIFAERENHINGIENFWSQAKRVLRKYNGINRKNFPLFLKECEFRFNVGAPKMQLKTLRRWYEI